VNQNPERPFGVLVDTRLPVDVLVRRELWIAPIVMTPDPVEFIEPMPWGQYFRTDFRAAFRNAEAAEASE